MQVATEERTVCPLVAESPPQHVMAQMALLVTKLSENAIIARKIQQQLQDTIFQVQWMQRYQLRTKPLYQRIWPYPFRLGHMGALRQ